MNVDKLNSWLSVMANIGVLIGIVFLALEVRHASNATQAQVFDSVADGSNALNMVIMSDPQVARVFVVGHYEPDELSDAEAVQFAMYLTSELNQFGRMMRLNELGLLSDSGVDGAIVQTAGMLSTPGGRLFLESNKSEFPEGMLDKLQPHLGKEPTFDFILGRDSLPLE